MQRICANLRPGRLVAERGYAMKKGMAVALFLSSAMVPFLASGDEALIEADRLNDQVEFAPGATGMIPPEIVEQLRRAKRDAADLRDRLSIQDPADRDGKDLRALEEAALENLRARRLLGHDPDASRPLRDAWPETHAFLFASFSLPPAMLRALMEDATRRGIPTVFRGFKGMSVIETRAALLEVFGSDEEISGFSIDPTLFRRFDVRAVPTLIVLDAPYAMCESAACRDDPMPIHDRIAGGITLEAGLELIARGNGDATATATRLLEAKP